MRLQVKGKNVEVTPSIREYAEAKLAKLEKQLAEQTQVELELSEEKNPSIAASHVAEATIFTKGPTLRAREASPDMKASIDQLVEKLERQVKRYREKRTRGAAAACAAPRRVRRRLARTRPPQRADSRAHASRRAETSRSARVTVPSGARAVRDDDGTAGRGTTPGSTASRGRAGGTPS